MNDLVLVARVAGQRVAFDAALIESVIDLGKVVPVPLARRHVSGLAATRSRVLTVIDAAAAIGLPSVSDGNRAIVILCDGHRYAVRVDTVDDVAAPIGELAPFETSTGQAWREVATGMVDTEFGFALLIDPARLVAGPLAAAA